MSCFCAISWNRFLTIKPGPFLLRFCCQPDVFFCCARNTQTTEALPQITIANAFLGSERRRIKSVGLRYGAWVMGVLHSVAMATRTTSVHVRRAKNRPKRMVERVVLSLLSVGIYTMANASLVQAWARSGPLRAAAAVAHHIGRNRACVQQVICASWLRI